MRRTKQSMVMRALMAGVLSAAAICGRVSLADPPGTSFVYQGELKKNGSQLATNADLLLLDEPTSGLATRALDNMVELIDRLRKLGKTLLVVEHNTRLVQQIADEVIFLHQGHNLAQGSAERIVNDPALAEIYFGGAL